MSTMEIMGDNAMGSTRRMGRGLEMIWGGHGAAQIPDIKYLWWPWYGAPKISGPKNLKFNNENGPLGCKIGFGRFAAEKKGEEREEGGDQVGP